MRRLEQKVLQFGGFIVALSLYHLHLEFGKEQERQERRQQELLEEDLWASPGSSSERQRWCQAPPKYKDPTPEQKLPFLTDVFAADQGKYVYFIGYKMGVCTDSWHGHQEFHSNSTHNYYFQCQFGGSKGGGENVVVSDPVVSKFIDHPLWSDTHFTIRCPIPRIMQLDLSVSRLTTKWTVSLYSKTDPHSSAMEPLDEKRAFQNLSLCNGEWPNSQAKLAASQHVKHQLSMMTKISTLAQVQPSHIVSWIEHHRRLGVESFIIYDNEMDPNQHRPLSVTLSPYIEQGLVTYIWYPIQDCVVDNTNRGKEVGERFKVSQITAANGVLRRYAHRTKYMIHADTDEFILLPHHEFSLLKLLDQYPNAESFAMKTRIFEPCGAASASRSAEFLFDQAGCSRPDDSMPRKLILRPDKVFSFFMEHPLLAMDGDAAKEPLHLDELTLAHYLDGQHASNNEQEAKITSKPDEYGMSVAWQRHLKNTTRSFLSN